MGSETHHKQWLFFFFFFFFFFSSTKKKNYIPFLYIYIYNEIVPAQLAETVMMLTDNPLSSSECLGYDTKLSESEGKVLEIWRIQNNWPPAWPIPFSGLEVGCNCPPGICARQQELQARSSGTCAGRLNYD